VGSVLVWVWVDADALACDFSAVGLAWFLGWLFPKKSFNLSEPSVCPYL